MGLAVNAKNGSVCINHGNGIKQALNIPFIKADRNHDPKFSGNVPENAGQRDFLSKAGHNHNNRIAFPDKNTVFQIIQEEG